MKIAVTTDTHYCESTHEANIEMLLKLEQEKIDLLIHCGDVSSTNYIEQKQYWGLVRAALGNRLPIVACMGNHDWWDKYYSKVAVGGNGYNFRGFVEDDGISPIRPNSTEQLISLVKEIYCEYRIQHVSEDIIIDNVVISGFDGWYFDKDTTKRITNDKNKVPHYYVESESWLIDRNVKGFEKAINNLNLAKANNYKTILVTHFGFTPECKDDWKSKDYHGAYFGNNPRYSQYLQNVDYLFYGHSHQEVDYMFNNTRIINAGSDYYMPKYKIIEV